jgi:hypothetical protein
MPEWKERENKPRHEKVWTEVVFLSFGKKSGRNFCGCFFCSLLCRSKYRAFGVSFPLHYNSGGANSLTLGYPLTMFGSIDNIN